MNKDEAISEVIRQISLLKSYWSFIIDSRSVSYAIKSMAMSEEIIPVVHLCTVRTLR